MANIFASLASGTKFSMKKNKDAIDIFRGKEAKQKAAAIDLFGDLEQDVARNHSNKHNINTSDSDSDSQGLSENEESDVLRLDKDDEINAFRNKMQIKVKGDNIPKPCPTFYNMDIFSEVKSAIIKNIEISDWKDPTPIQMQAIPSMLLGRDVLAAAPTGSGKTAAFVIPALSHLKTPSKSGGIRVLLLAPTKELAEQIHREVNRLIQGGRRFKICLLNKSISSRAIAQQEKSWSRHYDLLVATPLRLLSVVREGAIDLSKIELIVLDEADKLFELDHGGSHNEEEEEDEDAAASSKSAKRKTISSSNSREEEEQEEEESNSTGGSGGIERVRSSFLSQVDEILAQCPQKKIQRALFSATVGPFVKELADGFLKKPVSITIGKENVGASTINQRLVFVGREDGKLLAIRQLVQSGLKPPVLLFMQSIDRAKELYKELVYDGINVDVMHAERSAAQREDVIRRFRTGDIWILICTDLMARGIDFKAVAMVINYDLPLTAVSYIHRIGRTGRAGRTGEAVTFFTEQDLPRMRAIANVVKLSGCDVPDWMLAIKPLSTKGKKQLRRSAPLRRHISDDTNNNNTRANSGDGNSNHNNIHSKTKRKLRTDAANYSNSSNKKNKKRKKNE